MKKSIFALVVLVGSVCIVNASMWQKSVCRDKSLQDCIKHYDEQCNDKNYQACGFCGRLHDEQEQYSKAKKYYEMVCDKANSKDSFQVKLIDGNLLWNTPSNIQYKFLVVS